MSYKTQMYCHMHLIRFIYRTGGDVRCFKNLIAPPVIASILTGLNEAYIL